jgi:hypothetical protein
MAEEDEAAAGIPVCCNNDVCDDEVVILFTSKILAK